MKCYRAAIYLLIPLVCQVVWAKPDGKRCYSCTSYMSQCKGVVDDAHNDVFKEMCKNKCFVRMGEDGALYRGCFDGFVEVGQLSQNYNGCKNQTWNGKTLPWCMCENDLCNSDAMNMGNFYNIDAYLDTANVYEDNTVYVESSKYDDNSDAYAYNSVDSTYATNQDNGYNYDGSNDASAHQDASYRYDNAVSANQDSGYRYDSSSSANQDRMNKFAREGPNNPVYDETLFGANDVNTQSTTYRDSYRTPQYRTTHPSEYQGYYQQNSQGGQQYANANGGGHEFYYPRLQYQQENQYNRYEYPYSRESGPEYNYNHDTYQDQYNRQNVYNEPYQQEERGENYVTSRLAAKIRCSKSGYYQNPNDCRQFIACLIDPYTKTPVMHLMKCPEGLVWDNTKKICMQYSSTCNVAVSSHSTVDDPVNDVESKVDVTGFNTNSVDGGYYGDVYSADDSHVKSDDTHVGDNTDKSSSVNEEKTYQEIQDVVF